MFKNNMKKILLFIKIPPPITGATLMNQYVAESNLLKDKFNITTIGISYNKSVGGIGNINPIKFLLFFKYTYLLFQNLWVIKPNLVYFQISPLGRAFIRDLFYVSIIKLFKIKIVFHIHAKGIKNQLTRPFNKFLYQFCFNKNEIITLSKLLNYDITPVFHRKIHIIPNGIPLVKTNIKYEDDSNKINVLFLSNLIESKGILDFIDSIKILKLKGIHLNANIVGKEFNISKKVLTQILIKNDLMKHVNYLGPKYDTDKNEILEASDIFIFPTKYPKECFPLVILEAMQFGLPIIATNEGAIPEIIDDRITGFIVEINSPQQIAEKVEYLINNSDIRIKMGQAARQKFLENYTISIFEQNMKTTFSNIFNN